MRCGVRATPPRARPRWRRWAGRAGRLGSRLLLLAAVLGLAPPGGAPGAETPAGDKAAAGPTRGSSGRTPLPDDRAVQQAEARVREELAEEFAAARRSAGRLALGRRLLEQARQTQHDTAKAYALLRRARDLAVQVGDADVLAEVLDEITGRFEVEGGALRRQSMELAAGLAQTPAAQRAFAQAAVRAMERAVEGDDYEAAVDYGRAAYAAAGKSRDEALVSDVARRGKQVVALQQEYARYLEARQALAEDREDPAANLVCGRYLCLAKGQWTKGLLNLARGSDPQLQAAARADIALLVNKPAGGTPQAQAELWWALAEGKPELERKCLQQRAAFWYTKALPNLEGLEKAKAAGRLGEVKSRAGGASPEEPAAKSGGSRGGTASARPPTGSSSAKAAGRGAAIESPPGQWIDLLERVEVAKDSLGGQWKAQPGGLAGRPAGGPATLLIPVVPEGDYDLRVKFTRGEGDAMVGVILPAGPRQCLLVLSQAGVNGLDMIDNNRADKNASTSPGALNNGRAYTLEVRFRLQRDDAAITVELDGRPWLFYRGPVNSLALHEDWKLGRRAGIGLAGQSPVEFHAVQLRPVGAGARSTR